MTTYAHEIYPIYPEIPGDDVICSGCEDRIATEVDQVTGEAICTGCRMDREDFRSEHPDRPRG